MNWRVGLLVAMAFTGGVMVLLAIVTRPIAAPPHEIFVNGHVLTMDASGTIAEAVSVRDGRIEAIGRSEALLEAADEQTLVVDLRGRTLMPGLWMPTVIFPARVRPFSLLISTVRPLATSLACRNCWSGLRGLRGRGPTVG